LGALRSALSAKAAQQKLTVVEAWTLETHKTKSFRQSLGRLDGQTRTILLVENAPSVNLERASRNLEGVTLVPTTQLDTYDLMRHDHVMLSREAALKLSNGLSAVKSDAGTGQTSAAAAKPAAEEPGEKKTARAKAKAGAARVPASRAAKKGKAAAKPKAPKE